MYILNHFLFLLTSGGPVRELDVNRFPAATTEDVDDGTSLSSPSSSVSPFGMDFSMRNNNADYGGRNKRENEGEAERGSDDDENGSTRKKLRLSKDQSAFLEESFKEHTTLNPVNFLFLFIYLFLLLLIKVYLLINHVYLFVCRSKNLHWLNSWILVLVKLKFGFKIEEQGESYPSIFLC